MKVLLITPPHHCGVVESAGRWLPLGLLNVAGALRAAGHDVVLYDAMVKFHNIGHIKKRILAERPDVVGVTACTASYPDAMRVMRAAREVDSGIITVMGGVHPTFMAEEVLRTEPGMVDYVICGEGEAAMPELLSAVSSGSGARGVGGVSFLDGDEFVPAPERGFIDDLESFAPAWDLLDWGDYTFFVMPGSTLASVSSSRGCGHDCIFCSQQKFWKRTWRGRSPEAFVAEVEMLRKTHGANVFLLCDEYPTSDRARWEEILDRLIALDNGSLLLMETRVEDIVRDADILWKYRKAGVIHIYIGVEATSQATLDRIKKDIKVEESREAIRLIGDAGMITETSFILGFPEETEESIEETLRLAKYYGPDFAHFLALCPWPYADMYGEMRPHIEDFNYTHYDLVTPVIRPIAMSRKKINDAIVDCYRRFYMERLPEFDAIRDEFRRNYLLTSMRLMMKSSFLTKYMKGLGGMPAEVERYLAHGAKPEVKGGR